MKTICLILVMFNSLLCHANIYSSDTIVLEFGDIYLNEFIYVTIEELVKLKKDGFYFDTKNEINDSFINFSKYYNNFSTIYITNRHNLERKVSDTFTLFVYKEKQSFKKTIRVNFNLHNYTRIKSYIKSKTINDTTLSLIMSYQNLSGNKITFFNRRKSLLILPPYGKIENYKIDIPLLCKDYAYIHNVFPENYKIKINKLNYYFSGVNDKLIDFDSLTTPCNPIFYSDSIGYNFGKREIGSTIEGVIKYKNIGNAPLLITATASSCGCFDIKPRRSPLEPGGIDSIYFKYDNKVREGKFFKTITIYTNDPNNRYVKFPISVEGVSSNNEK